jgi:carboxylate-amine ligase
MLTTAEVERAFDAAAPLTIGVEEELMLLDPETLDLAPLAAQVLERTAGDPRFKRELPAAQVEIITAAHASAAGVAAELAGSRRELAGAAGDLVGLAGAGVHPFAAIEGPLNDGEARYRATEAEFGALARRQLVFALQVHVAPGSAARALGVYNALRSYLPEIAALAANAPYRAGVDTGLASVRPKIAELLPRQGVPPALESWDEYAEALAWGRRAGTIPEPGAWWWELRPHPGFGTLELRVPDAQTTVPEAAAIAAFVHCLVAHLGELHDARETPPAVPSWRIAENRWRALRDGVEGELADLASGEPRPARERLRELRETLAAQGERLGCTAELALVDALIAENGAMRQRRAGAELGAPGLAGWLRDRFVG